MRDGDHRGEALGIPRPGIDFSSDSQAPLRADGGAAAAATMGIAFPGILARIVLAKISLGIAYGETVSHPEAAPGSGIA